MIHSNCTMCKLNVHMVVIVTKPLWAP